MKRIVVLLLTVLMISAVLCGCQNEDNAPDPAAETQPATPAETVVTEPTPEETEAPATEAAKTPVDPSWFDDAVFIGDSITEALDYACADDPSILGNASFICATSLGYHNALWDLYDEGAVHPVYRGETILAETAAAVTGADKVFILLGVNDIGTYGAEDTMEKAAELSQRILACSPNVTLYFQSTTPMVSSQESGWLNNNKISDFNTRLQAYCEEQGFYFIDLYHQVCDENGKLKDEYCYDPDGQGIHFNGDGCRIWSDYLKEAVADMPAKD